MNMFVRCALVLVLTVALVQTLKCYKCKTERPTPTPAPAGGKRTFTLESKLSYGVCKDGELGNLVDSTVAEFATKD